jgi:hypothetical protein
MATGLTNYNFTQKRQWRRRIWNEAVVRLRKRGTKVTHAKCLYLPGPDDYDREIAVDKGFLPQNLFAVEVDPRRVQKLRQKGVNVINADFMEALNAWPRRPPLDFVFADLCGGINKNVFRLIDALLSSGGIWIGGAVVAVNLLRGRDSVHASEIFKPPKVEDEDLYHKFRQKTCGSQISSISEMLKHRGFIFQLLMVRKWIQLYPASQEFSQVVLAQELLNYMDSVYETYTSKMNKASLRMDSIVFNWETPFWNINPQGLDKNQIIRRKITAARAINTMRYVNP